MIRFAACDVGYYGTQCQHKCSVFCKDSRKCNHVSGFCDEGCKAGWHGDYCLQCKLHNEHNSFPKVKYI